MKNYTVSALIGLLSLSALVAAPSTGLPGGERKVTAASAARVSTQAGPQEPSTPATNVGIRIKPIRIVPAGSTSRTAALDNLFGDLENGRPLDIVIGDLPATGSEYSEIGDKVPWTAFGYAGTGEFLLPGESGWTVEWLVEIYTLDGTDNISFNEARFSFTSSDLENVLGHTSQWWDNWYSLYARGYKAGMNPNSPVITGPGDQKVSIIRVVAWSRLFNGAGTPEGAAEIKTFVENHRDPNTDRNTYGLKLEVDLINGAHGERMVETNPVEVAPVYPVLEISGGMVRLVQGNGLIYLESSLDMKTWTRVSNFVAQGYEHPVSGEQQFYRAARQ